MSNVQDIKSSIRALPHGELADLRAWLVEYESDAWDAQIAADAENGRLMALYLRLQKEDEGHPDISLDDFLDQQELSK